MHGRLDSQNCKNSRGDERYVLFSSNGQTTFSANVASLQALIYDVAWSWAFESWSERRAVGCWPRLFDETFPSCMLSSLCPLCNVWHITWSWKISLGALDASWSSEQLIQPVSSGGFACKQCFEAHQVWNRMDWKIEWRLTHDWTIAHCIQGEPVVWWRAEEISTPRVYQSWWSEVVVMRGLAAPTWTLESKTKFTLG